MNGRSALGAQVVNPPQLAVGTLQRAGLDDVDGAGGSDVDLDLLLQNLGGSRAALGGDSVAALDPNGELVHAMALGPGKFQLEVRAEFGDAQGDFLDLRREEVHAAQDDH